MKQNKQTNTVVLILKIFTLVQFIQSQSSPCDPQKKMCCDQSCMTCSQTQISQCTSCNLDYFYLNNKYQCSKTCPLGTYLDSSSNQCITCVSQFCSQCSKTQCFQCMNGFYKDPNDPQNCISQCSQQGQIQDEDGQCKYGCVNDQIYDTDYQSFSCQVKIQCPQIQQIPQIQIQNNIVSSLLDSTQTVLTLIDSLGIVAQYSYPLLQVQQGYQLNISSFQVVECQYQNQIDLNNNIVTCLLQPLNLLKFYNTNGTIIQQSFLTQNSTQNTGNYIQSFYKGGGWNLILAQASSYEIDLLYYSNTTYFRLDNSSTSQLQLFQIQQYNNQTSFQSFCLNFTSQAITFYQIVPYQKVLAYSSSIIDSTTNLIQLNQLYYWILYTSTQVNLLYFNPNFNTITQLQTIKSVNLINSIFLAPQINLIVFVTKAASSSYLSFNLYSFEQSVSQILPSQINFNNQISNINQVYTFGSQLIICTSQNVGSYQFSSDYSQLQLNNYLQQTNPSLCAQSLFSVKTINSGVHIWQTIQKNFIVNTFNTINQQKNSYIIAQNAVTSQVQSKLNARIINFYLFIEYSETQRICEVKHYGLALIYDIITKKIVNQVRLWYPINELSTQILYNQQILPDGTYLFAGFERYTFTIKIINLKTFEIIYQQSFPEINIQLSSINYILNPLYYPNSDSIIVVVQYFKQLTDTQKNYNFLSFTKNTGQNSTNRYQFVKSFQIYGYNFIQSVSVEYLILFNLTATQRYTANFYNLQGTKITASPNYLLVDTNRQGQVNEQTKQVLIYSYYGIYVYNLTTLNYVIQSFTCAGSFFFVPTFKYYYTQSVCQTYQDGVFSYPNNTLLSPGVSPKNKFVYIYKSYYNDNYIVLKTSSSNLIYYDNTKQQLFAKTTQYGSNYGGMIEKNEVIFFNSQAVTHYDQNTFNLIYLEDSIINFTFILQTQFLRFNYLQSTVNNLVQVKKVQQITLQVTKSTSKQPFFISFVSELNYVIEILPQSINIYNALNNQIIQTITPSFQIDTKSPNPPYDNFWTQELFTRKIFYYQPNNLIVIVYYESLICIDGLTFQILYQYKYYQQNTMFKNIVIDWNRGYLISTNLDQDCILNMNTIQRTCYKDNPLYQGLPDKAATDYMQFLFINNQTNQLIICQMISVRIFDLVSLKYVKSIYDTNLYAAQYYFNPNYNYLIYSNYLNFVFILLDLSTMQKTILSLPPPSTDYQSINYRFFFLDDKQSYIFLNSNYLFIYVYDQITHQLINKIPLTVAFFPLSDVILDQSNQYIFLFDLNNCVNQYSYSANKLLQQFQLNQTDALAFQKYMIWDSYKQRLILSSNSTVYLISTRKNLIELYQVDTFVTELRLFSSRNIIQYSTYYQNVLLDYDYLLNDNQEFFPNQVNPRFFQVNSNTFFQLNDINTQANLFINQTITSTWIRNNLNSGYIRIVENDFSKSLVYAIFDNEIVILDLSTTIINQIDQVFISQNIIKILFQNNDQIILLSQSQQLLQLQKRQKSIQLNEVIVLKQGLAQYLFTTNLTKLIFTDFTGNQQNINIVNLIIDSNNNIKGISQNKIVMPSRILSIQQLNNSQIVILMSNLIKIYDYILLSEIASAGLELGVDFGNILIDTIYQRIFLQNQLVGSLIYNFNLQKQANSFINSFSNNLYFDDTFIYSVVSHSANIYFRQDLKFLFNYRHFDTSLKLKNISYLGVGYFFLVEFITKFSIFEFSPFVSLPTEKAFVYINQYSIINFQFVKLLSTDINNSKYQLNIKGFTLEGMFTYNIDLDIYSQQQTQTCSLNYQLKQYNYQDDTSFNQMSTYLTSQQRKLNGITINISKFQNIHIPQLQQSVLNSIFQLIIAPDEQNTIVYIQDSLKQQQGISFIQIKNLEIQSSPLNYNSYILNNTIPTNLVINSTIFTDIKQVLLENITITEASLQINNIQSVVIQKLNLQHFQNQTMPTLTQLKIANVDLVVITEINLVSCSFNLGNPLIILESIGKLQINNITVSNCACTGLDQILLINQVQNLTMSNIFIYQSNFTQQSSFTISSAQFVNIGLLQIQQIQFNNNQQSNSRFLQAEQSSTVIQKLLHFSDSVNLSFSNISLTEFNIDTFYKFIIFDFELIQGVFTVNQTNIQDINIKSNQIGTVFSLSGVYSSYLKSLFLSEMSNMRFILLQSYQISDAQYFQCKNITITNLTTINIQIAYQSFIQITTVNVIFDNIQATKMHFSDVLTVAGVSQQISFIQLVAANSLILQNSYFSEIVNQLSSSVLIQNSFNVNINNINFNQITTNGTSSALAIFDSSNVILQTNTISQCQSFQDSGAIQINNCQQVVFQNNTLSSSLTKSGNGGALYLLNSQINNIDQNQFMYNSAYLGSGGAIYCQNSNLNTLNQNFFIKNLAIQGSGGAILLNNCDVLQIQDNQFSQNQAIIGGAIRYINLQPLAIMQGVDFLKKINSFYKNSAVSYGINVGSYPKILDQKNYLVDNQTDSKGVVFNVQSGYKSSTPILMRFIDEEMREMSFINLSLYPQVNQEIKQEISLYILQAESQDIGLLGDLRQVYSFTNFAFKFDLSYSYQPSSSAILNIKSAQLLPQFDSNNQQVVQQQFNVPITIYFRKCQVGEVIQKSGNYTLCQTCEQGSYSITDPYSETQINCKRCPIGSTTCQSSFIQVQNGYWRVDNMSDFIIQCQYSEFCKPEDPTSKNGCIKGHIGPICQECDVRGQIWGSQYSKSNQDCSDCSNFISPVNIILMLLILGFIFIQIFTKIHNEIVLIRKYIMAKYLSKLRFISPNIQRTQTSQASLIKILLNYFQFLMIVNSLNITLPAYFTFFNLTGGDTSQLTINSMDCLLFSQNLNLPNYVLRLLWINFQPLALFILLELLSQFSIQKNIAHQQRQALYTNLIIIFIFFQPSVVKVISQSLSCQQIGQQNYISLDLNYDCLDSQHIQYILQFILPLGMIWIVLIPIFLLYRMRMYKPQMQTIKILFRYGYLYQEYESDKYYWDLARIFIRSTAIIVINIFNFQVLFKGMILFGVMFFYLMLQKKLKPFILQKFNDLEQQSSFLVIITIYLLFVGALSSNYIISYVVTILIGVLNSAFILKMLQLILIKPIPVEEKDRNKFQNILFMLKQRLPIFFIWVKMGNQNSSRPFKNWKKVSLIYQQLKQHLKSEENNMQIKKKLSFSSNFGISLGLSKILKNQETTQFTSRVTQREKKNFKLTLFSK
ncbi:hypothetical protein ABPG74_020577 [Tetrahymena malaccensis]